MLCDKTNTRKTKQYILCSLLLLVVVALPMPFYIIGVIGLAFDNFTLVS